MGGSWTAAAIGPMVIACIEPETPSFEISRTKPMRKVIAAMPGTGTPSLPIRHLHVPAVGQATIADPASRPCRIRVLGCARPLGRRVARIGIAVFCSEVSTHAIHPLVMPTPRMLVTGRASPEHDPFP